AKGQEIKQLFEAGSFSVVAHDKLGAVHECADGEAWHRDRVLQLVQPATIQAHGFRVFLDANGGAGGPLGKALLDALQANVIVHGAAPDGDFAHPPEPLAENLGTILPLVSQYQANAGFVLDPDADRLAIIDEKGQYIGEELTLALAAMCRLRQ